MPTVLSMLQGGIVCASTRVLIERAHGRVSSNVTSDIGAIESGRWHASHFSWKIGAISFVKVGAAGPAANAAVGTTANVSATTPIGFHLVLISRLLFLSYKGLFGRAD